MTLPSVDFGERFKRAATSLGLSKLAAESVEDNETVTAREDNITDLDETTQGVTDESVGVPAPDEKPSPVTAKNIFQHPDTHPIMLDLILLREYGPEWMTWEPETLEWRIPQDFGGQNISDANMHKVQALKTLHFNDNFWEEWEVFVWCCMAFNGVPPDFEVMQVPTVAQAMVAVDVANRVRQDVEFSEELNDFLEQVHMFNGTFCPIEPLEWVTMDDVEDYPVDCEEVKELWPEVRKSGKAPTGDTVTDEQLRRMLDVREYLEESRAALRAQLPLTTHV
jgi:hypothetical protein